MILFKVIKYIQVEINAVILELFDQITKRFVVNIDKYKAHNSLVRIHELITRIKSFIITPDFDAMCQAIESIRSWERPLVSVSAWIGWLLFVNCFRLWMIPLGLAIGVLVGSKEVKEDEEKKKEEKKEKKHSKMKDLKFIANSKEGNNLACPYSILYF